MRHDTNLWKRCKVLDSLVGLMTSMTLVWLAVGALAGVTLGAIPGLGGIVGLTLLLPFAMRMEEASAYALIVGLTAAVATGDTIPSIIWGVPGTVGSAATVIDGHQLALQGHAIRALSASYIASVLGGIIGALILMLSLPLAAGLVLSVGSPEMLMIGLLGIAMISVLSSKKPLAGIGLGLVGFTIGMIGQDPQSGIYRWTFGQAYLLDGIPLVPMALGLFAVPEAIDLALKGSYLRNVQLRSSASEILAGAKEVVTRPFLVLRNGLLGSFVGAVPGIGASVVDWIAYGHTVQWSKDKSRFGKGDIRGVIGPESANNANVGGSLIPTLVFGIPGGLSMVFVLAALVSFGVNPGPSLVTDRPDIVYLMMWAVVVANVIAAAVCLLLLPQISKVCLTPAAYLIPAITAALVFAAIQSSGVSSDLITLFVFGVIGWVMHRLGWSRPVLILAFILGPIVHQRLQISNAAFGSSWMTDPAVLVLALAIVLTVGLSLWKKVDAPGDDDTSPATGEVSAAEPEAAPEVRLPIAPTLSAGLFVVFVLVLITSRGWPPETRSYAWLVGVTGVVVWGAMLVRYVLAWRRGASLERTGVRRVELLYLAWLAGCLIASWLLGLMIGLAVFVMAYLKISARKGWGPALAGGVVTAVSIYGANRLFSIVIPDPVLFPFM
jgi:putative tricarboxylic transport membrane protein